MITLDDILENASGKRYGHYLAIVCPFHDDHSPSMFVYPDGYRCQSCGVWGKDLEKLLRKLKNQPEKINNPYGRTPWRRWLKDLTLPEFADRAYQNMQQFPQTNTYLRDRGITRVMIDNLRLGYWEGYYTFPIFSSTRRLTGMVARAGQGTQDASDLRYITPPNQEPQLYCPSWSRVNRSSTVYFPFGIIDCLILYRLGLPVMTWSVGKGVPPEALKDIRKRIVFVPDLNEEDTAMSLVCNLGWRGAVKRLQYPLGTKDPADIYRQYGKEQLAAMLGCGG